MNLSEKAAYLKGLADGLEISDTTKEGKLLKAVVELLDEMANSVSNLEEDVDQIYDELDAVDEDMDDLEEYVFGDEEDYEDEDDEEEDEDEDPYYEITCPKCGLLRQRGRVIPAFQQAGLAPTPEGRLCAQSAQSRSFLKIFPPSCQNFCLGTGRNPGFLL